LFENDQEQKPKLRMEIILIDINLIDSDKRFWNPDLAAKAHRGCREGGDQSGDLVAARGDGAGVFVECRLRPGPSLSFLGEGVDSPAAGGHEKTGGLLPVSCWVEPSP